MEAHEVDLIMSGLMGKYPIDELAYSIRGFWVLRLDIGAVTHNHKKFWTLQNVLNWLEHHKKTDYKNI